MPITITGWLKDFRPLVRCSIMPGAGGDTEPVLLDALIDTGATDCHIRADLQERLGLPATEQVHTVNIGAAGIRPVTRIEVVIPGVNDLGQPQNFVARGARTFIGEFDGNIDIIIGMNVLRLLKELRIERGVPVLVADS
jgi:predicted aspartyl protease